jgi:hypothetical protein
MLPMLPIREHLGTCKDGGLTQQIQQFINLYTEATHCKNLIIPLSCQVNKGESNQGKIDDKHLNMIGSFVSLRKA